MEAIACTQLSQRFGARWILARLELRLGRGTRLLLTGANGAGKTTLLRILATALRPSRGAVRILGRPAWPHPQSVRGDVALLTHQHYLYEGLSAAQNLAYVAALLGRRPCTDPVALLQQVGLADVGKALVATFSAGMKRRLALARLLLLRPAVVLLDEPFAQLDPEGQALVYGRIAQMGQAGATLVISSHDVARVRPLCTHRLHLTAGHIAPAVATLAPIAAAQKG